MGFFVIELRTRAVHIAGMRINPDGAWMMQIARIRRRQRIGGLLNYYYREVA